MRALFVNYAAVLGGAERVLVDLLPRLPDCESEIACPEGELAAAARARGIRVHAVAQRRVHVRRSLTDRLAAPARLAGHALEVRRLARTLEPDVVVAWGSRSGIACAFALRRRPGRPALVYHGHDMLADATVARAVRASARRADLVISPSLTVARDIDPHGALGGRSEVVNPGVDIDALAALGPPPASPHVLVLGAIVDWKRPMLALDAAAVAARSLPDLELTVAGPALDEAGERLAVELRRRAERPDMAGRVHLPGALADVRPALERATCLLHCADCEPFGVALVEALAAGRPVVAPSACGPAEIVTDDCGRLFAPGDADSAAAALVAVHARPGLPAELGARGHARARERWALQASADRYRELLERVTR